MLGLHFCFHVPGQELPKPTQIDTREKHVYELRRQNNSSTMNISFNQLHDQYVIHPSSRYHLI